MYETVLEYLADESNHSLCEGEKIVAVMRDNTSFQIHEVSEELPRIPEQHVRNWTNTLLRLDILELTEEGKYSWSDIR